MVVRGSRADLSLDGLTVQEEKSRDRKLGQNTYSFKEMREDRADKDRVRNKNNPEWAGEMAQWLRSLLLFQRARGSIPSTHMAVHNCL